MVMNVSVVIPTYNRKPILEKCLKALEKQTLNNSVSDYEIIVIAVSYTHLRAHETG